MITRLVMLALAALALSAAAIADVLQSQTAQESKADSLHLTELAQLVENWTDRCSAKEAAHDPTTGSCWESAAYILTPFTSGISETLLRQVEELQGSVA